VYHPERERHGNWVPTVMGGRYDALCSFADTGALDPLPVRVPRSWSDDVRKAVEDDHLAVGTLVGLFAR
jgi:hypothetical protein